MTAFAGAVLAGGSSRRMGQDKALLELGGQPLVLIAEEALRDAGADRVGVVGGDARALAAIGLDVVADRWPGEGPLGGLVTALEWSQHEITVVLACDLPAVTPAAIRTVVAGLGSDDDAAMPHGQYLLAAYRSRLAAPLAARFDAGERALHRALEGLQIAEIAGLPEAVTVDVDTPASLDRVRRLRGGT